MAHMHYTGTGKMHSFRGLLEDEGQNEISIQGSVGGIAWRITKFELMASSPVTAASESVMMIWREQQSSISSDVNFANDELLGSAVYSNQTDTTYYPDDLSVVFDNALFVRNIWITHKNESGANSCNYYIELEQVKVSATGMAQLAVAAARRTTLGGA